MNGIWDPDYNCPFWKDLLELLPTILPPTVRMPSGRDAVIRVAQTQWLVSLYEVGL